MGLLNKVFSVNNVTYLLMALGALAQILGYDLLYDGKTSTQLALVIFSALYYVVVPVFILRRNNWARKIQIVTATLALASYSALWVFGMSNLDPSASGTGLGFVVLTINRYVGMFLAVLLMLPSNRSEFTSTPLSKNKYASLLGVIVLTVVISFLFKGGYNKLMENQQRISSGNVLLIQEYAGLTFPDTYIYQSVDASADRQDVFIGGHLNAIDSILEAGQKKSNHQKTINESYVKLSVLVTDNDYKSIADSKLGIEKQTPQILSSIPIADGIEEIVYKVRHPDGNKQEYLGLKKQFKIKNKNIILIVGHSRPRDGLLEKINTFQRLLRELNP